MTGVFSDDVAVGNDMAVRDAVVVITHGGVAADTVAFINFFNTVGIQCIFIINDGVEADDISLF